MRKIIAVVSAAAVALAVAGVSLANHDYTGTATVAVIHKDDPGSGPGGNVFCPANTIAGPEVGAGQNFSNAYLTVTNNNGTTFDWAFTALGNQTYDMAIVIVKGGPASAVYTYDYAAGTAFDDSDTGLAPPVNPNNGKDYGISGIRFCFDPKGGGDD